MHVQELARRIGAVVDPTADLEVTGVSTVEEAGPSHVTFLANPKYVQGLRTTRAGAAFVSPDFPEDVPPLLLRVKNPYLAFARSLEILHPRPRPAPGVHATAVIGRGCELGKDVHVGAFCVVGDGVTLGDEVVLHPHVVVYDGAEIGAGSVLHSFAVVREGCRLGERTLLQNGAVIGADGFGFAPEGDGRWHKIPQVGTVELGDHVEVQANACVDRAAVGTTRVGRGTKIDNLVQVGHGCTIGENTLLCGQVGLAGSTHVGDRVIFGGQASAAGHVRIGDDVHLAGTSGVHHSLTEPGDYGGVPAIPLREFAQQLAAVRRLPDILQRLRALERKVGGGG